MKIISKKSITFGIILLFIGVSVSSGISIDTNSIEVEECKECNEFDDKQLLILERQLNRLERYSKLLLVFTKDYPEINVKIKELSDRFKSMQNWADNRSICILLYNLGILFIMFTAPLTGIQDFLIRLKLEDGLLYNLIESYFNMLEPFWNKGWELYYHYECHKLNTLELRTFLSIDLINTNREVR